MPVEHGGTPDSPPVDTSVLAPEAAPAAAQNSDASPAVSSPANDESLLDRVKAAIKPKPEGSSPLPVSQEASPNPEASSEDDEQEPDSDPTEEEQARYHSKTRKQIRRLLAQRNEALDEVKTLKPEAEGFRKITNYFAESGISSDEANVLFDIGRNMKRDPLKALEQLKPYYDALQRAAGDVLPEDLQTAVTKGEITETYARQIARGRTQNSVLAQRTQAQDVDAQRRQAEETTQRHAETVATTISNWESTQAKSDPDWNLKQSRIGELIELEIRRTGYPKTAQAALDLAEKAKTSVDAEFARLVPRKQAVTPVNPASAARVAPAKPTTALEAARQALAATG